MGDDFFRTVMGRTFYEGTMPRIAAALHGICKELERFNNHKEQRPLEALAWETSLLQLRRAVFADQYIDSGEDIETIVSRLYTLAELPVPSPLDPEADDPRRKP